MNNDLEEALKDVHSRIALQHSEEEAAHYRQCLEDAERQRKFQVEDLRFQLQLAEEDERKLREEILRMTEFHSEKVVQLELNYHTILAQNQGLVSHVQRMQKELELERKRRKQEEEEKKLAWQHLEVKEEMESLHGDQSPPKSIDVTESEIYISVHNAYNDLKIELARANQRLEESEKTRLVALQRAEASEKTKLVAEEQLRVVQDQLGRMALGQDAEKAQLHEQINVLQEEYEVMHQRCQNLQAAKGKQFNEFSEQLSQLQQTLKDRSLEEDRHQQENLLLRQRIAHLEEMKETQKKEDPFEGHKVQGLQDEVRRLEYDLRDTKDREEKAHSELKASQREVADLMEKLRIVKAEQNRISDEFYQMQTRSERASMQLEQMNTQLQIEVTSLREQGGNPALQTEVASLRQQMAVQQQNYNRRIQLLELSRAELVQQIGRLQEQEKLQHNAMSSEIQHLAELCREKDLALEKMAIEMATVKELSDETQASLAKVEEKHTHLISFVQSLRSSIMEDADVWHKEVLALQRAGTNLQRQNDSLQDQNAKLSQVVQRYQGDLSSAKGAREHTDEQLMELRVQRDALAEKVKTTLSQCEEEKKIQMQTLHIQVASLQKECESQRQASHEIKTQLDQVKKQRNALQDDVSNLTDQIHMVKKQVQSKEAEIHYLKLSKGQAARAL